MNGVFKKLIEKLTSETVPLFPMKRERFPYDRLG